MINFANIIGLPRAIQFTSSWLDLAQHSIFGTTPKTMVKKAEKIYSTIGLTYTPEQKEIIYKPLIEAEKRGDEWATKKYVLNPINPLAKPTEAKGLLANLDLGNALLIGGLLIGGLYLAGKYIGRKK